MTRPAVQIKDGWLHLDAGSIHERRRLEPKANERFEAWARTYRDARERPDEPDRLLALGQDLFAWLNGEQQWTDRLREAAQPPLIIEFAVPLHPEDPDLPFLNVPWELLADKGGHLAADPHVIYCPVRRIGEAGTPAAPSEHRLSMVFMAAAPHGTRAHLRYEEEEAAILDATGRIGMDLVVEESGCLSLLAECVADAFAGGRLDVLHLSCHGKASPAPHLLLENEEGEPAPAGVDDLTSALGGRLPQLLCLSACETAEADEVLGSLGLEMIRRGAPAVLGWGGSVRDAEATRFAAGLYAQLALHLPLAEAVARARFGMLSPPKGASLGGPARDWHLAQLFLGPKGGGVLSRGKRTRRRQDADHAYKAFLNQEDREIPVAGRREFVGRRRQVQTILKEFRERAHRGGVVIHGMGRQGKSSLAARIAHRLSDHTLVVLHGQYDAATILEAFARFAGTAEVSEVVGRHREAVAKDASALETALRELL